MPHPADLAFSETLVKYGILPYETIQREFEILNQVSALGFKVNLARSLKDRKKLDAEAIRKILGLSLRPEKQQKLADHLRALETDPAIEPPITDLMVDSGLVMRGDLDAAMGKIERAKTYGIRKRPLEALVDLGLLLPDVALALFDVWKQPESALLGAWDLAFCRAASETKVAAPADLQLAVSTQRRMALKLKWGRPVAEILWALGRIAPERLAETQALVRARFPGDDPAHYEAVITTDEEEARVMPRLGAAGVSPEQLEECLRLREALLELGLERRTGEVLLMRGYLRRDQLAAVPGAPPAAGPASPPPAAP